jgi:hypothetical protein
MERKTGIIESNKYFRQQQDEALFDFYFCLLNWFWDLLVSFFYIYFTFGNHLQLEERQ